MNEKERMKKLIKIINDAAEVYYNTGEEKMPNIEYDKLYDELEALEKSSGIILSNSPTQHAGTDVKNNIAKITHEYPALSLAKTKDISLFPKTFAVRDNKAIVMWKEDGGTLVATYDNGKLSSLATRGNGIVGQDKVDRMVRLSKINALLLGSNISNINIGNSITGESSIDKYSSRADVIFTNPPFGAEHEIGLLNLEKYPILQKLNIAEGSVNSELLMLDRCIGLLKDNGYLVIVLPDSVFASKGMNSLYRDEILKTMQVRGVIELPSVTFAQAGTRTNTCIFYLQKKKPLQTSKFFMASCKELGYVVKEKMGVPVKISKGQNQMEIIARALVHDNKKNTIVSETPSITNISKEDLTDNILKPGFYSAERIQTIEKLSNTSSDIEIKKLSELVDFVTKSRKGFMVSDKIKHISVLHINPDCTINFDEVEQFEPISKGRSCQDGDLIFSKLNPSIPRMAIVPKKEYSMVCSNEFEIMRTKGEIDAYTLCFLLRTENVQNQIEHLTSGTSSSHSRIKQEQLAEIMIPVPKSKQKMLEYKQANEQIKKSIDMIYEAKNNIKKQLKLLSGI